jgi:serine/threonine protein kinase
MHTEPLLLSTGRRLSINSGLQNRVQAFSPNKIPRTRQLLLTPKEVKQLVLRSTTTSRLDVIKSQIEQRVELQVKKSTKEKQRQVILEFSRDGRWKQWEASRAQLEKPVKYHGAGQLVPSKKIQWERSIDISSFDAPTYGPKTTDQRQKIIDVVERNFVFSEFRSYGNARTQGSLEALIDAFEVQSLSAGHILWAVGDAGEQQAFYILDEGTVIFHDKEGTIVASVEPGDSLGEQSLIHAASSSVTALIGQESDGAVVLKLEPRVYRGLLQLYLNQAEQEKRHALKNIEFLKDENDDELLRQLTSIMTRVEFCESEKLHYPEDDEALFIIQSGKIRVMEKELHTGDCFGERVLLGSVLPATHSLTTITGLENGVLFRIERNRMETIFGSSNLQNLMDVNRLIRLNPLNQVNYNSQSKRKLARRMTERRLTKENPTFHVSIDEEPTFNIIREGTVTVRYNDNRKDEVKTVGDVVGYNLWQESVTGSKMTFRLSTGFSATIQTDSDVVIGVLPLHDHDDGLQTPDATRNGSVRSHFNKSPMIHTTVSDGSLELRSKIRRVVESDMDLADFDRIKLLGEGMFGEVWLVAADIFKTGHVKQQFALKSQRKVDDTRGKDALSSILREVKAMKDLDHPQLVDLVHAFEDQDNIYMLMGLIPGGELWDRIYEELPSGEWSSGLSEANAKFYLFSIAETLSFIHSKKYVFRDLKPENVMLDSLGYPVLVDFGFAKYVEDKTFTFCGTPNYCAPEIILNSGHNHGVDHWALGVTLYEMISGENPFFFEGMDIVALYDTICREPPYRLKVEDGRSENLINLIDRLLEKDPTKRLGMMAGGMQDILDHAWFNGIDRARIRAKRWPAPWKPEGSEDKATQEMMESSMTASFGGLGFASTHSSAGSINFSCHDRPIAEIAEEAANGTDSESFNDSFASFHASFNEESMNNSHDLVEPESNHGSDGNLYDQPVIHVAIKASDHRVPMTHSKEADDDESILLSNTLESSTRSSIESLHEPIESNSLLHNDDEHVVVGDETPRMKRGRRSLEVDKKSFPLSPTVGGSSRSSRGSWRHALNDDASSVGEVESPQGKKDKPLRKAKVKSTPKVDGSMKTTTGGNPFAIEKVDGSRAGDGYFYVIKKPGRKSRAELASSRNRRSAISGALAGLGIGGSDEESLV